MNGQEIFRFVYIDSPNSPKNKLVVGREPSPLLDQFEIVVGNGRLAVFEKAQLYLDGPEFDLELLKEPLALQLKELHTFTSQNRGIALDAVELEVQRIFASSSAQVSVRTDFKAIKPRIQDSLLALKLIPETINKGLILFSNLFESCELIDLLAEDGQDLSQQLGKDILLDHLVLPATLFPLPPDKKEVVENEDDPEKVRKASLKKLEEKLKNIERATQKLASLKEGDFIREEPDLKKFTELNPLGTGKITTPVTGRLGFATDPEKQLLQDASDQYGSKMLIKGKRLQKFQAPVKTLFTEMDLDLSKVPATYALEKLEEEAFFVVQAIAELKDQEETLPGILHVGTSKIPGAFMAKEPASASPFNDGLVNDFVIEGEYAHIRPAGVGNLMVTRQHILRYEAGEIAHIENVMQGETKERETRRLRRTEESIVRESETTKEEERDLQSTERLEMRREVENTVKENSKWSIGAEISGGYGPFIQVSVSTDYSNESSSESVSRNASSYSREVTEKTATKISERIREEQTLKTLQEFEEKIRHSLDASDSDDHIVGMFRWVDKFYEAQTYDYGSRVFFDVMVPEPAKILLYSQFKTGLQTQSAFSSPDLIEFRPKDLSPSNYDGYVKKYQAKGVNPPPPLHVTVAEILEETMNIPSEEEQADPHYQYPTMMKAKKVTLPSGYKALEGKAYAQFVKRLKKVPTPFGINVSMGTRFKSYHDEDLLTDGNNPGKGITPVTYFNMASQHGSTSITVSTHKVHSYMVTFEIKCIRTDHAMDKWRLDTYNALVDGYQAQLATYQEQVAQQAAGDGITFEGRNPLINRRIERNELKRASIGMFTEQHFNDFTAYKTTAPVPTIDFEKARKKGRFARFFEQAFEWENMVYELLPYYWGNRNKWVSTLQITDNDPLHEEFLKSGFARVRIPVRPDFEAAVFHYLDTGKIWTGSEPPRVTNTKHLPFLYDVLGRRHAEGPGREVPIGEPWQYTLPTTLVRVEDGSVLPEWVRGEDGNWVPVEQAPVEEPLES